LQLMVDEWLANV